MTEHPIRLARLTGFLTTLIATIVVVGSLRTAPLPGLGASSTDWFREVAPAEGVLAILRLVVLVGAAYLLLATLLTLSSTILHTGAVDRMAARCTGPTLQRFLRTSAGIGIGTVTSIQSLAAGAAPPPVTGPHAEEVTTLTRVDGPTPDQTPTEASTGPQTDPPAPEPNPAATTPAASIDSGAPDSWTVAPGDHLWHIAEETLLDLRGEAPSPEQTVAYWHAVCEANHDRLVDPDNPDLILPGQQIALPPVPASP